MKYILLVAVLALFTAITVSAASINGCTNPRGTNYNPLATVDDGSCIILGCTNKSAYNYDKEATVDNKSCKFHAGGDPMKVVQSLWGMNGYEIEQNFITLMRGEQITYIIPIANVSFTATCPTWFSSPAPGRPACWTTIAK